MFSLLYMNLNENREYYDYKGVDTDKVTIIHVLGGIVVTVSVLTIVTLCVVPFWLWYYFHERPIPKLLVKVSNKKTVDNN